MRPYLLLSPAAALLLSVTLSADDLGELTITSTQNWSVFNSMEFENTQEIRESLPSNLILSGSTSGFKLDGATADFTTVYWNGIKVSDPSNTNAYPTFMNYGRNGSDTLRLDGSSLHYQSEAANHIVLDGGSGEYGRGSAATSFEAVGSTHALKLEGHTQNTTSNYSVARESDSSEETDRQSDYTFSYLGSARIAERYSVKAAYMYKKVAYEYDGGYPTDPDDTTSSYEATAHIGGIEAGYDTGKNRLKADLQVTQSDSEHEGGQSSTYTSQITRYGLKGGTDFGSDAFELKGSLYSVRESAKIDAAYTDMDETRTYTEAALSLRYATDMLRLQLAYDQSYEETRSYSADIAVALYGGLELLGRYDQKQVNPTLIQENNPYGASNDALDAQKLTRISGGIAYNASSLHGKIEYSRVKSDDQIAWVTVDPQTYTGQYQNIDETEYDFVHATLDAALLQTLRLTLDYAYIGNITSSNPALLYNLPEHKGVGRLDYDNGGFGGYLLGSHTATQQSYSGDVAAATIFDVGVHYRIGTSLELHAALLNIADTYYESVRDYPEAGRIFTAGIGYTF